MQTDWRARLRERLALSGKTRTQVGIEAGLNPAYMTQVLEQKGVTPTIDNLKKIAGVLNTTVMYLVDGAEMDQDAVEAMSLFAEMDERRRAVVILLMRDLAAQGMAATALSSSLPSSSSPENGRGAGLRLRKL